MSLRNVPLERRADMVPSTHLSAVDTQFFVAHSYRTPKCIVPIQPKAMCDIKVHDACSGQSTSIGQQHYDYKADVSAVSCL
eukprot:6191644-Pleurochrysis_carterae.AAC.3